jgi:hypothetical protein
MQITAMMENHFFIRIRAYPYFGGFGGCPRCPYYRAKIDIHSYFLPCKVKSGKNVNRIVFPTGNGRHASTRIFLWVIA